MHDVASLATFSVPLVGAPANDDELLRHRLTSALALPLSEVRVKELDRVKTQLSQRLVGLFMDEEKAEAVAATAVASASQLEGWADHLWSSVLHIYEQFGGRAKNLLTPTHQLVLTVRELADQLAYSPSVAHPVGIMKGINASQLLDRVEAVCKELDEVYTAIEALPAPDAVSHMLLERRAKATAEDEETAKEQSEEDEHERLLKEFETFMANFDPTPELRELGVARTDKDHPTSDGVR
jgi:ribosomal protein L12E/L44/L45/RPP1/RPP2